MIFDKTNALLTQIYDQNQPDLNSIAIYINTMFVIVAQITNSFDSSAQTQTANFKNQCFRKNKRALL